MRDLQAMTTTPAQTTRPSTTARCTKWMIGAIPFLVHALALAVCARAFDALVPSLGTAIGLACAAIAYPWLVVLLAGGISRFGQGSIVPGRFERDPATTLYRGRMIYGAAWTTIYYCKPLLHAIFAFPLLKTLTFRLFGYQGSLEFTAYPDTWIRDLPLLELGAGTYVSNRATIGTNIVRGDGMIVVDRVRTGKGALIGHLAMVAPGTVIGDESEVGVGAACGLRTRVGDRTQIGPRSTIDHGARIGDRVSVGTGCYVGKCAVIRDGLRLPAGLVVPDRSVLRTQDDVRRLMRATASPTRATMACAG